MYVYIYIYIYRELTTPQETNECNPKVDQRDATDAQKWRQLVIYGYGSYQSQMGFYHDI